MYGIIAIIFALLILLIMVKLNRVKKRPFMTVLFLLTMLYGMILCYVEWKLQDKEIVFALGMGIGLLFILVPIYGIYNILRCTKCIQGIYRGYNTYSSGVGPPLYAPVFEYDVDAVHYYEQSGQFEKLELLEAELEKGRNYPIYIHPKNPYIFILKKKIHFFYLPIIFVGLFFLFAGYVGFSELL